LLVGWCERHRSADQIQDPQPRQRDHVIQPIERRRRFRADRASAALTEAPTGRVRGGSPWFPQVTTHETIGRSSGVHGALPSVIPRSWFGFHPAP
jgi:hypothetical protein